jgi:protein SCO1/2
MRCFRLFWATAACMFLLASANAQAALFDKVSTDLAAEIAAARSASRPLAVMLVLKDCPPCLAMKRTTLKDPRAQADFGQHFRTVTVSLDAPGALIGPSGETTTAAEWAQKIGAAAAPSFVFFDRDGQFTYRHVGALSNGEALNLLGRFVDSSGFDQEPFSEYLRRHSHAPQLAAVDAGARLDSATLALPLLDQHGRTRHLADFRGRLVLLSFGYTSCPDVCPTTLAELAQLRRQLGRRAGEVQVLFVTLDPERDTQSVLAAYVAAFDSSFIALRGDRQRTDQLIEALALVAEKRGDGPTYSIDHTAGIYVIDRGGRLRGRHDYGEPLAALQQDVGKLLKL